MVTRFIAYSLRAMGTSDFLAVQAGNVRQRSVDFRPWDAFARIPFPRPPVSRQAVLADVLDVETRRIDALVEKKRKMIGLLDERRVALTDGAILSEAAATRTIAALATYVNGWPFAPGDFTATGLPVIRIAQRQIRRWYRIGSTGIFRKGSGSATAISSSAGAEASRFASGIAVMPT